MIPLKDNNPTASFPIVTVLLIALNVYIFFFQPLAYKPIFEMIPADIVTRHAQSGVLHISPDGSTHFTSAPPEAVNRLPLDSHTDIPIYPTIEPTWLTIFTAMFLHANFLHLAGNMLFLWIFGNNVEDAMGRLRYLIFYLVCGLVAALAQISVDPYSLIPTLGASGAIAGVLGAYIVLYPGARVLTMFWIIILPIFREISAFWVIGIWIALQIIEGVSGLGGMANGGVAYFAHIGGFFSGLIMIQLMGGRKLGQRQIRAASYSKYSF